MDASGYLTEGNASPPATTKCHSPTGWVGFHKPLLIYDGMMLAPSCAADTSVFNVNVFSNIQVLIWETMSICECWA